MGDFKPYLMKSSDRGRTWKSIAGDLPARGTVYSLVEDPVDRDLLFAGTEFGLWTTVDGGAHWVRLKGGLPTIQVRDLAFHAGENDLVLGTFGRGFYVLDDVTPLRSIDETALAGDTIVFDVPKAPLYVPVSRIGGRDKGFLGESFYTADNPPYGATFTWYLKEEWLSAKKKRQKAEKEARDAGKEIVFPAFDSLRAEKREEEAKIAVTIVDEEGEVVRRLETKPEQGLRRLTWDLRYPPADPASRTAAELKPWESAPIGPFVAPGTYRAKFDLVTDTETRPLGEKSFEVAVLEGATLPAADREAVLALQKKTARLQRAVLGAEKLVGELGTRLDLLRVALDSTPAADPALDRRLRAAQIELEKIGIELSGDAFLRGMNENTPVSISERVQSAALGSWTSTAEPTATQVAAYRIAGEAFAKELAKLRELATTTIPALEAELEKGGAPWTPGRIPEWAPEP